jgi:hypothetical protein
MTLRAGELRRNPASAGPAVGVLRGGETRGAESLILFSSFSMLAPRPVGNVDTGHPDNAGPSPSRHALEGSERRRGASCPHAAVDELDGWASGP